MRSDNGGEYISSEFKSLLTKYGIKHELSAPHSPHQNGTAERNWRTLFDMARALLVESGLPKYLWTYALMTATTNSKLMLCSAYQEYAIQPYNRIEARC